MLRKLGKSNQLAIPKKIVTAFGLKKDDYIDIYINDNKIILEPKVVIAKEQSYFYTSQWQTDEQEAEKDIKSGKVTKTKDLNELFDNMDK